MTLACPAVPVIEVVMMTAGVVSLLFFLLSGDEERFYPNQTNFFEFHHFYLGVVMVAVGLLLPAETVGFALRALGVILMIDDAWQHVVQSIVGDWEYQSPLAWVFHRAADRFPVLGDVAIWLDAKIAGLFR